MTNPANTDSLTPCVHCDGNGGTDRPCGACHGRGERRTAVLCVACGAWPWRRSSCCLALHAAAQIQ